jgi:hypothetical protein
MVDYIEKDWREITSRNPVKGVDFPSGLKDFKFSIPSNFALIPRESYFTVELKLDVSNLPPVPGRETVFAEACIDSMFSNIYFNIGSQTVSSLSTGCGQVAMLRNRLTQSKAYNDSIGQSTGFVAHYVDRQAALCDAAVNDDVESAYAENTKGRNNRMFIWRPPIGAFDVDMMGCGEYDIQLNPNPDYIKAATESLLDRQVGINLNEVNVTVNNIKFYACVVRTNHGSSGIETLKLTECSVNTFNVNDQSEINEELSVPSTTKAISCWLQHATAGKNTLYPPSRFRTAGKDELTLQNYQIQYAGQQKPCVRYQSNHTATIDTLHQRYLNTALEAGHLFHGSSGFESYLFYR